MLRRSGPGRVPLRPRVLVAENECFVRAGLECLLGPVAEVVGNVSDLAGLRREAPRLLPDVVVASLPVILEGGLASIRELREAGARVVVLASDSVDLAAEAFDGGASGWLLRSSTAEELRDAVCAAAEGGRYLTRLVAGGDIRRLPAPQAGPPVDVTPRALEVLRLLAQGKPMKQVAADLRITPRTVAFHKYKTMRALGIDSSAGLVRYAVKAQLV
jgi:DNA-binding NarL/FixJ family response regulator